VGGAIIWKGKILDGNTSSLELGHVPLDMKGKRCGCGARGCIETYLGNKYLMLQYNRLKKSKKKITEVKEIFQRAQQGEKEALIVWDRFSLALGKYLRGLINIFNPEVIVFGGGVSGAFSLFKPRVARIIREEAMWPQCQGVQLLRAKIKDAGIVGAGILAKERLN
jgi:glucokinase